MEKHIEEVVNEDRNAREKVENAKRALMNITSEVTSKSHMIYQQFMEDEKKQMNQLQKEMDEEVARVKKQCSDETEEGLKKLSELFEAHKDEWVRQIVNNVLN